MENTLNYINASLQNFSPIVEIEDKQIMAVGYLKEHGFDLLIFRRSLAIA